MNSAGLIQLCSLKLCGFINRKSIQDTYTSLVAQEKYPTQPVKCDGQAQLLKYYTDKAEQSVQGTTQ